MLGFIVEGHMEADIINHICKSSEVRRLQMNGVSFPVSKICERIIPQVRMLYRKRLKKIVIIIDREQREISSEDFEKNIRAELTSKGVDCSNILITCPDRNFESWIVPFVNSECELAKECVDLAVEGRNGKSIIRGKYRSVGKTYVETVDGVRLFKLINPHALRLVSVSFDRFMGLFDENCWWLERNQSNF